MDDLDLDVISVLLAEGGEDYLGLWQFLWEVRETLGIEDPRQARAKTMELVGRCLAHELIAPGFPVGSGPGFDPWNLPAAEALERIRVEWDALENEPFTGDVCWFVTTSKGKEWLARYRRDHRAC